MPNGQIDTPKIEHGIALAVYAGGPGEPYYRPVIECSCGYSTGRQASWQFAGKLFDLHLAEVSP